jgi:lipase chaperone LimK
VTLQRTTLPTAAAVLALLTALTGGWWLATDGGSAPDSAARPAPAAESGSTRAASYAASGPGMPQAHAQQRQPGPADAQADVFLTDDLRFRFEALLLEAGEAASPSALKLRLAALLPRQFIPADRARALALLNRYVDYRVALGSLKAVADAGDPRALRTALEARQQLREQHFDSGEYGALFADEDTLDRFSLARLEIERNGVLTVAQKQAAVRQAESGLSAAQRAGRADSLAHEAVAAQTADFESQHASPQERYAQRRAQHGDDAALQLAQLDTEERDWQTRLDQYASAKASSASPAQLEQLERQLFSANEQLRLEAALTIRQQRAPTPAPRQ